MKVLFLGYTDSALADFIRDGGDTVIVSDRNPFVLPTLAERAMECRVLISYGYREILRPAQLALFHTAINLHISYLPWNRGADPNLWSWIDGTPKGVTIHHLDEGVDTGDIIAQRRVDFGPGETLASSYTRLRGRASDDGESQAVRASCRSQRGRKAGRLQ